MNTKSTQFRWFLAVLMFLISFISYMDRVNLSVATPEIMKEFSFSKMDIGLLQTAFFLGYSLMQIPGGIMSEIFGHRVVITVAATFWSIFTALTATCNSLPMFAVVRTLFGIGEGPLAPSFSRFIYRWFNSNEKARGASFLLGGVFFGPVVGPAATVALMLAFGWRSVFVIFGAAGIILAAAWYYFATESPRHNKFVNAAEVAHIEGDNPEATQPQKELAPWRSFLTSPQFWAIGIQFFITDYIMYVFLAWLPLYLMEAQNFSLQKMGIAASFPWAALCIVTFATGYLSDKLIMAGVSKYKVRTLSGVIGLALCCVCLYLGAIATTPTMNVFWLTLSLGSLGLTFNAGWAACIDLGGKFSGSVSGWMNFWGNLGGVAAPLLTAWIATNYGWQSAITVTSAFAIIGMIAWFLVRPERPLVPKIASTPQSCLPGKQNL
ncbi:MFS transporter [Sporomusa sp.]|uniref:MFS transporter n=1 Tax=Sporomusa sp. TaxID=2078658 RepID=UPI002BA70224|nr:MFS transporter [Sporomusa sp.]HWR08298.1 MFS transporter [Sporomusa sp.]